MTTKRRKAQLKKAEIKLRTERTSNGWKRLWIPPSILGKVRNLIAELNKRK